MSTLKKKLQAPLESYRAHTEGPWALQLAMDIIEQDFGLPTKVVAEALVELGMGSVADVRALLATKPVQVLASGQRASPAASVATIKAAILILLTHGLAGVHVAKVSTATGTAVTSTTGSLSSHVVTASGVQSNATSSGSAAATGATVIGSDFGAGAFEGEETQFTPSLDISATDLPTQQISVASTNNSSRPTRGRGRGKAALATRTAPVAAKAKEATPTVTQTANSANTSNTTANNSNPTDDASEYGPEKYRLDLQMVLMRARYPQFIAITKRQFGDAGAAIAQCLLQHGPWRKPGILSGAAKILATDMAEKADLGADAAFTKDTAFPMPPTAAPGLKRKRSTSSASAYSTSEEQEDTTPRVSDTLLQQAHQEAAEVWSKMVEYNFLISADGTAAYGLPRTLRASDAIRTNPSLLAKMGLAQAPAPVEEPLDDAEAPAKKRPRKDGAHGSRAEETLAAQVDPSASLAERSVVWRFGWEAAMKRLRNDLILRYVKGMTTGGEAVVDLAKRIVDVIMRRSEPTEKGFNATRSASISIDAIVQTLQSTKLSPGARSSSPAYNVAGKGGLAAVATPSNVYNVLSALSKLPTAPVVQVTSVSQPMESRQFYVDYSSVLTLLQLRTIENIVQEKFHVNAARIVRLLLDRGALDEKNISDLIMLPQKDARAAVFNLVQSGVLHVQEVPRRPDHHPQFTFFLFTAHFHRLVHELSEWNHQAVFNLRRRLRMEVARFKAAARAHTEGTMQLPATVRKAVILSADVDPDEADLDDEADINETALTIMEGATERLRAGLLRTDSTLLLLRDLFRHDVDYVSKEDLDNIAASAAKVAFARR